MLRFVYYRFCRILNYATRYFGLFTSQDCQAILHRHPTHIAGGAIRLRAQMGGCDHLRQRQQRVAWVRRFDRKCIQARSLQVTALQRSQQRGFIDQLRRARC